MTEINSTYGIGDWVVHHDYGIGQIREIEEKLIHGEQVACFRVRAKESAQWWFPKTGADNPRIRPVASKSLLQRAQRKLQKIVRDLNPDRIMLKSRIDEARASDGLIAACQIVRDITILKTQRKLSQMEMRALDHFTDRLLREWAATMNKDIETIRPKLSHYLDAYKA
jgi:RNA polymerase-interacting CarD/CdnL/TRCF family regulator